MAALETLIISFTASFLACDAEARRVTALRDQIAASGTDSEAQRALDNIATLPDSLSALIVELRAGILRPVMAGVKLSPTLRRRLSDVIQAMDTLIKKTESRLNKVNEANMDKLSVESVSVISRALDAYLEATRQLAGALKIAYPEKQDLYLSDVEVQQAEYKAVLAEAPMLSNFSIFGPLNQVIEGDNDEDFYEQPQSAYVSPNGAQSNAGEASMVHDEPPPYVESQLPASSSLRPRSCSSGSDPSVKGKSRALSGLSNLTEGFKAMVTGFHAKPDPLVSTLCEATRRGELLQMKGLIGQGVDIDGQNQKGHSPVHVAIEAFENEALKLLLESGADWTSGASSSRLPLLFHATAIGNLGAAQILLGKGAKVDEKAITGQPYFAEVVSKGCYDGVKFLLENGADANTTSLVGRPVLGYAIDRQDKSLVRLLVLHGAKLDMAGIEPDTILGPSLGLRNLDFTKELLALGADPNATSITGASILSQVISRNDFEASVVLLSHGTDPNSKDLTGVHVLMCVLQGGLPQEQKLQLIRLLLQNGADPNVKDLTGHNNCIIQAIQGGDCFEITDLLLRHGADPNSRTSGNEPLLLRAMVRGRTDQVASLLRHGANPNVTSAYRDVTPLMMAIMKLNQELVKMLIKHGASVEHAGEKRIQEFAQAAQRPDLLAWLEQGNLERDKLMKSSFNASFPVDEGEAHGPPSLHDDNRQEGDWAAEPPRRDQGTPPPEYSRYGRE